MVRLQLKSENIKLISTDKKVLDFLIDCKRSNYLYWFGDQEVNKYNSHGLFPQSQKELEAFFDKCENDKSLLSFMIMTEIESDNEYEIYSDFHIGMCSLQRIDWINRSAEFAIVIGEKDYWGKGIATKCINMLLNHAFMKLGLNRVWSGTSELNIGMIKCFEKLGMKKEGTYCQGQFLNGKFYDVYAYAILKKEWDDQWQKLKYNDKEFLINKNDSAKIVEDK